MLDIQSDHLYRYEGGPRKRSPRDPPSAEADTGWLTAVFLLRRHSLLHNLPAGWEGTGGAFIII